MPNEILPSQYVRTLPSDLPVEVNGMWGQQSGSTDGEVQLREYIRVLYKYHVIILSIAAITLLLSLVYAFVATPMYTAEGKVRISTYEPVLTATKIEDLLQEKSREANYLETQVQEMKSYSLADKVLEDPQIRDNLFKKQELGFFAKVFSFGKSSDDEEEKPAGHAYSYKLPVAKLNNYLSLLEIRPIRRTSLVSVFATSESPSLAALIANKHSLTYMDWVRENRVEQQASGLSFLRSQADELREKVADLERELADYAEANSIVALNKDENITVQKMAQLNKLLTDAISKRITAENMYQEASRALESPSAGFDDVSTQDMRTKLATLEAEHEQLSAKFTAQYPKVQQIKAQIEGLQASIQAQRRQVVLGLKAKMMAVQQEEKNLTEELEQQKSQTFELSKRQVHYNVLNRELTSSRDLLQNVLKQIKETSLAVESNASNVSVVDYAVTPNVPSFPRKKLVVFVGLLIGLGLGVGVAFLLNHLDNTMRTPEDVNRTLGLPSLGVVPSFELEQLGMQEEAKKNGTPYETEPSSSQQEESKGVVPWNEYDPSSPVMFLSNPKSLASEAYRTIRTAILLSQAGEPPRIILVSSAQSSEGKTTSSINLAASLASSGGNVVIIDADLRRPSVHKHFTLESNEPGLVEILTGQLSFEQAARENLIKRVTVVPSGKIPPNPAELLGSKEMIALIKDLSQAFDYVIIDSPPILPVTDSVILSRYVDGVVLVVRGATTPKRVVRDAKARLQSVGARVLGTILNDVDVSGGDYYYYNRYYYSYYHNEDKGEGRGKRSRWKAAAN